ncbi:putative peptidoglycan-binding domain-containing protein [Oscillatoria acuminata PCC 6304]|uniref:Putative peptidoglycan-binding domain-containing protein n=2 Tax=Oscillatoria acuminata TaxID=118323 RepID=K9TGJ7_9CYAN|nr:putative peptidoglycan-binding domain-containing protein [Oscillatoria acuminata PCC 6304]
MGGFLEILRHFESALEVNKQMALQQGDTGPQVEQLQRQLEKLGYNIGRFNPNFGPLLNEIVQGFQAEAGLVVDGIVGDRTQTAIDRAVAGITLPSRVSPPPVSPSGDFTTGNWPEWRIVTQGGLNARSGPGFEFPVESTLTGGSIVTRHPDYTNPVQGDRVGKPWLVITNQGTAQFIRANNQFIEPDIQS